MHSLLRTIVKDKKSNSFNLNLYFQIFLKSKTMQRMKELLRSIYYILQNTISGISAFPIL